MISLVSLLPQDLLIPIIEDCAKNPDKDSSKEIIQNICDNITYNQSNVNVLKLIFDNQNFYPLIHENRYLRRCSLNGLTELVPVLLKNMTTKIELGNLASHAVYDAIDSNQIDTLKILLNDERTLINGNSNGICLAAKRGYIEIVKLLLENPKVDPTKNNAIRKAAKKNHIEIVKLLLPRIDIKSINRNDDIDRKIRELHKELNPSSEDNIKNLLDQLSNEMKKDNRITKIVIEGNTVNTEQNLNKYGDNSKSLINEISKQLMNEMKKDKILVISIDDKDNVCIKRNIL